MSAEPPLLLALDLAGTFVFGLNGALTAVRVARLDIVGVVALGMATALGGGVIRDVLIGPYLLRPCVIRVSLCSPSPVD
jgi:uncharacterized membrane protein YeiH